MSLDEFLISRKVSAELLSHFKDEKIDCSTILLMSDDELKSLLPKYGDRVAVKNFAVKKSSSKKQSLIEKLREKISIKNNSEIGNKKENRYDNKNKRQKTTRFIEIGWYNLDQKSKRYRQVRKTSGGGTRRVQIEKSSKCKEILEAGKRLFFPNGKSTKGQLSQFNVELLDFKCHPFDINMTIQEMYDLSALTTLRFYIATTKIPGHDDEDYVEDEDHYIPSTEVSDYRVNEETNMLHEFGISKNGTNDEISNVNNEITLGNIDMESLPSSTFSSVPDLNARLMRSETLRSSIITDFASTDQYIFDTQTSSFTNDGYTLLDVEEDVFDIPLILPASPNPPELLEVNRERLILHRGNIFRELIEAVQKRNIDLRTSHIEMILPNGKPEAAADMGGVLRDTISEFFGTFYDKCTLGAQFKVPCLRHDFQKEEWSAIGKVIKQGFLAEKYFPIRIAPIFIKDCLRYEIKDEEVLENFLQFVSASDSVLLRSALENFDNIDNEELLEFCSNYDAKWLPTKKNFKTMLEQIAKEELLQKPSFVKECFRPHLKCIGEKIDLKEIYLKYEPTDKNIIAMLEIEGNPSAIEKQMIGFLKKYIKECDQKTRSAFVRFCTGSDLANHQLKIDFNSSDGFARLPVAHTCSGVLQLPTTYENFMSFRSEFNNLLNSNIWVMDII